MRTAETERRDLVGVNIRRARMLADPEVNQTELARAVGISRPRINDYEAGRHEPSWVRLGRIADFLGIDDGPGWFYIDHPDLDAS